MLKLFIIGIVILGASFIATTDYEAYASDCSIESVEYNIASVFEDIKTIDLTNSNSYDQQRGCCSHHGGVCGCEGGRKLCCDGTYSPSCTCHHDT